MTAAGQLGWRNDVTATTTMSALVVAEGWHSLTPTVYHNGAASINEIWVDGTRVADVSSTTRTSIRIRSRSSSSATCRRPAPTTSCSTTRRSARSALGP